MRHLYACSAGPGAGHQLHRYFTSAGSPGVKISGVSVVVSPVNGAAGSAWMASTRKESSRLKGGKSCVQAPPPAAASAAPSNNTVVLSRLFIFLQPESHREAQLVGGGD